MQSNTRRRVHVAIELQSGRGPGKVSVIDDGIGIPQEHLRNYSSFWRPPVDNGSHPKGPTGALITRYLRSLRGLSSSELGEARDLNVFFRSSWRWKALPLLRLP
jgi:hypothetical protein